MQKWLKPCGGGVSGDICDRVIDTVLIFWQAAYRIVYAGIAEDNNWEQRKKSEMPFAEVSSYKVCTVAKIVDIERKTFSIEISCTWVVSGQSKIWQFSLPYEGPPNDCRFSH